MSEYITIDTPDGSFQAYLARPESLPAPSVVVIQEIFGVNLDLRDTCDALAAQGYLAVSPDLFWRQEPGVELSDHSPDERKKAFALLSAFDRDAGVGDIAATMAAARALPGASGKIGVMGFCMGGLMTFLTAARVGADAAVVYYGGRMDKYLDEADDITTPLMVHLGEDDEYIPKPAQEAITAALADNPLAHVFTYPGANHAFARHRGTHYDADAAALANGRTAEFFERHLK
ncbi:dienelactone hydrolase family protein [Massilia sp. R2A-15]|uniref:dienelactone hydrolase family protein n=1 Tax=Massilia sp. R2A-15 TaxID=3064278 RepID=UPI0027333499|nr:dienelactone hydrolase family protein [Massilia sp. R2A-15]WLI89137.1 dienelactone hydrolase family protein [Massilia sp. R2A-15]